jgi:hypothetical protein
MTSIRVPGHTAAELEAMAQQEQNLQQQRNQREQAEQQPPAPKSSGIPLFNIDPRIEAQRQSEGNSILDAMKRSLPDRFPTTQED